VELIFTKLALVWTMQWLFEELKEEEKEQQQQR
jgi:hypothetical protein